MTHEEQEALRLALNAVNATNEAMTGLLARQESIERQIVMIAAAIHSLSRRLQLQEAGTALYEVANGISREAH